MKLHSFRQWWERLLVNRPPDDDWIEILIDVLGYPPISVAVFILIVGGFMLYLWHINRKWKRGF